ncbi:MAG: VWA domain-containing protein [Acidimicrobiia bacterium]|nr:VWA domain-containing protein [Acidimicrobiia bacterium]MDH4307134.1 VWA domain-containing protein [Acidimicrobiia bacterium]MDH5293966.1 VWA domain-containing protein [Acidimicrobiia bacterium]
MRRLTWLVALALTATACISLGDDAVVDDTGGGVNVPSGCREIPAHVSSEKVTLLTALAEEFNATSPEVDGECVAVTIYRTASGKGASLLAEGWPADGTAGPEPVLWSPASAAWGAVVNERLEATGRPAIAGDFERIMLTPLVLAMPRPMAEALGWPEADIGWADVLELSQNPDGWGAVGHPEWGPFKFGKTNPNFSTSGLSATIAIYSAATGSTAPLTLDSISSPDVVDFVRGVEAATVHYGDTTLTFLDNMLREDLRGRPLTYASAVAVEEVSVIAYNRGDPADTGEASTPPNVPLVAVYPKEGTLFSDNPAFILDADWVDDVDRAAAQQFVDFVVDDPDNQARVLEFGFRPGNPSVAIGEPITRANGLDPSQPETELQVPDPKVLASLIDSWEQNRKAARVVMLLDVSGSMADLGGDGFTKLDLAKQAVLTSLDEFKGEDEIGLWVFSTQLNGEEDWLEVVPVAPLSQNRGDIETRVRGLLADGGTGLYDSTGAAVRAVRDSFDPTKINAVILLSDGVCDDFDDGCNITPLLGQLSSNERDPVRVFPVAYGTDADVDALRQIAEASQARLYQATDPRTIEAVFEQVVSNF